MDLYSNFTLFNADTNPKLLLAMFTTIFMAGVFAAAFFYMIKQAIEISKKVFVIDSDRTKEILNIFKNLTEGISKYFLPFSGAYVITFIIELLLLPLVYFTGIKLIGHIRPELVQGIKSIAGDGNAVSAFVDSLSTTDILFFAKWSLLIVLTISVVLYILMLWVPEIIYKTNNPFTALFKSVGKVFKDFFKTLKVFCVLYLIGFLVFGLYSFSYMNIVLYFTANFVIYYFYLYMSILIFLYYDQKYNSKNDEE